MRGAGRGGFGHGGFGGGRGFGHGWGGGWGGGPFFWGGSYVQPFSYGASDCTYVAKGGETLASIAAFYGTSPANLAALNNMAADAATATAPVLSGVIFRVPCTQRRVGVVPNVVYGPRENSAGAPNDMGAPSGSDVASAAWTTAQLLVFAAAGAALGAVIASQQKDQPVVRNATIGAVALPVLAVL